MSHGLFAELKRRNVFKAGVAYLALGWIVTQVSSTVAPLLHLPDWIGAVVLWIGVLAFPFVIMFSWIYEITPEGLKRESEVDRSASITHVTSRRMDYLIVGLLVLAIGFTAFDRFGPRRIGNRYLHRSDRAGRYRPEQPRRPLRRLLSPAAAAVSDNSIAVLPFVNMSSGQGAGFLLGRHHRGTPQPPRQDPAAAGHGAHVVVLIQGQGDRHHGDREDAERHAYPRGLGAQVRQSGAHHGAAHQRG